MYADVYVDFLVKRRTYFSYEEVKDVNKNNLKYYLNIYVNFS